MPITSHRSRRGLALASAAFGATSLAAVAAGAQVSVAVDPTQDAHAISPLVYGMNFVTDAQVTAGKIPLTRWGGNSTTRYNYQIDVHNTGADWYFENIANCAGSSPCPASNVQDSSAANAFFTQAQKDGLTALFTVPTIGFTPKGPVKYSHPYDCGCPKTANASQDSYDQWDTNCGNGKSGGNWISCPDPTTTTSVAITPQWVHDWVAYLVGKFGPSNGKVIYELDNEPALWNSTHHDVRPKALGYDELWQRMRDYAVAILQADPTALIAGFEEWGWPNYLCSAVDTAAGGCSATSPDRAAHGGEELTAWILDQAAAYEKQNGKRILHYLDLHYYPQGGSSPANIRSLWDSTYTDPSWINDKIDLIPRMHAWVDQHYPGTRLGISEYDWGQYGGDHTKPQGAVAYAEVLGTFGREGIDYATAWGPPAETETAFAAYALYRNYDGSGGSFQPVNARATITGSGLQAYASVGATRMTVALVNETGTAISTAVTFGNFAAGATAHYYELGSGVTIAKKPDVTVTSGKATVTVGPTTIGMLVVDGTNPNPLPDAGAPFPGGGSSGGSGSGSGGSGSSGASSGSSGSSSGAGSGSGAGSDSGAGGSSGSGSGSGSSSSSGGTVGRGPGDGGASGTGGGSLADGGDASSSSVGCNMAPGGGSGAGLLVGLAVAGIAGARKRSRHRDRLS
jgi:hypothetical protein